jgi:thiamine monophosphate synthase
MPVVAIGGINRSNATDVLTAGASAIAVISCVLADPGRIADSFQQMMSAIE